ncbi:MAG: DNA-directed RNA polymerase subunit alpha [bacterium]|nr:DNA-directed RNA polymerase subunit alpha [bacterium]
MGVVLTSRRGIKDIAKLKRVDCEEGTLTSTYGKLFAGPFERGLAVTIGNSLRRMLLSSLTGVALTSVKIEGVLHEFSTIPGVVEDVTDIILNLKGLIFKLHGNGPKKIYLKVEKEGAVTGADLELSSQVELLNPDQHIATIDSEGIKLEMEIDIDSGIGYVPSEMNKQKDQAVGVIPVDSFFSPVKRVKYEVEDVRVEHVTDYERLIIEIWTNGSILPRDALAYAAKHLKDNLAIFVNFEEGLVEEEETEDDKERERFKAILNISVDELELSVRSANCLRSDNIWTLGELAMRSEQDMLKTRNFGKKSLTEIKEKLVGYGLHLGMEGIADLMKEDKEEE